MKLVRNLTLLLIPAIIIGALVFLSRDNPPAAQLITKTFPYEQTAK